MAATERSNATECVVNYPRLLPVIDFALELETDFRSGNYVALIELLHIDVCSKWTINLPICKRKLITQLIRLKTYLRFPSCNYITEGAD